MQGELSVTRSIPRNPQMRCGLLVSYCTATKDGPDPAGTGAPKGVRFPVVVSIVYTEMLFDPLFATYAK